MPDIYMLRDNLDDIPQYELPVGCDVHSLKPGEEKVWEWISDGAFGVNGYEFDFDKIMRSDAFYSPERIMMGQQYSQITSTASAWFDPKYGAHTGALHWVATHPTAQGSGLGRPVIAAALNKLRDMGYTRAMLITQPHRLPAIRLYMEFGFRPVYNEADLYEDDVRPADDDSAAQYYCKSIIGLRTLKR